MAVVGGDMSLRRDGGPDSCSGAPGSLGALRICQDADSSSVDWARTTDLNEVGEVE